jgi:hypothetical protein
MRVVAPVCASHLTARLASRVRARLTAPASSPVVRDALRDALFAWLGQRILLLCLVWIVQANTSSPSVASLYRIWIRFDGRLFADVASRGYVELWQAAFYPLFPALEHVLAPLVGDDPALAGLVMANVASFGAFVLLRLLTERDLGQQIARRTLLYLVVFPTSLFLAAAYSESLFLLLSVATFLALRERSWLLAGLLAALATLTRAAGVLLLVPLAVTAYTTTHSTLRARWGSLAIRERLRLGAPPLAACALPLIALAGLDLALSLRLGVPNAVSRAEDQGWGRQLAWPWDGLLRSLAMVVAHFPSVAGMDLLFAVLWLALAGAMLLPAARTLPRTYLAYTWTSLLLVLVAPLHPTGMSPLTSISRYLLVVFPCFVLLAQLSTRSRWLHYGMLAASACQLVAVTWLFAQGKFVA